MKILAVAWGEGDEKERKVRLSELEVKESREPWPEAEIFELMYGGWRI